MRRKLQAFCHAKKIAAIPAIEPTIEALASCLGLEGEADRPGSQHVMDDNYFRRIEALDFAIAHDDGQGLETLDQADVVLTGVSRTSKTPTCFYLAQRGVKAANVPLVPALPVPERLESLQGPLVVGLTAQPSRLVHVRRQRFSQKAARAAESYTDKSNVENEARFALQVFSRHQWPYGGCDALLCGRDGGENRQSYAPARRAGVARDGWLLRRQKLFWRRKALRARRFCALRD